MGQAKQPEKEKLFFCAQNGSGTVNGKTIVGKQLASFATGPGPLYLFR